MLALASQSAFALLAPLPKGGVGNTQPKPWTSDAISDVNGLKALAVDLNPAVGYW